ncbi:MAG: hypothetical protein M1817_001775 [Caeruleum heppii]|nr:MAG: hypothetical protein M1817_001775 [Caeruleum heppii]
MSGQLLRQFASSGQMRTIVLAERVVERGYMRVISAIDAQVKADTAARVEAAFQGSAMLSDEAKARIVTAQIVSMDHTSDADPEPHSTVRFFDVRGTEVATGHVPTDASKQQASSLDSFS